MATKAEVHDHSPTVDDLEQVRATEARVLAGAAERIHAEVERAKKLGIIDEQGRLLSKELPDDMQPGAKRDFGG